MTQCLPAHHRFAPHPNGVLLYCKRCGKTVPVHAGHARNAGADITRSDTRSTAAEESFAQHEIDPDVLALELVKKAGYDPEGPFLEQAQQIIAEAMQGGKQQPDDLFPEGSFPPDEPRPTEDVEVDGRAYTPRRVPVDQPEDDSLPSPEL